MIPMGIETGMERTMSVTSRHRFHAGMGAMAVSVSLGDGSDGAARPMAGCVKRFDSDKGISRKSLSGRRPLKGAATILYNSYPHRLSLKLRHSLELARLPGKAPHLQAFAALRKLPLERPLFPDNFIRRTRSYRAEAGCEEFGVAKNGRRSAMRRFSTLNDFLSTSANVTRPKKSSRICTRCPADNDLTTLPAKPENTPSAIMTSTPAVTPSSTTTGSCDSKHCFNSTIAAFGTIGIF